MPAIALAPALTVAAAVAPRASSALVIITRSLILIPSIFTSWVFIVHVFLLWVPVIWDRTGCSRAYARAQACADGRDGGRDCSAQSYALGYRKHTSRRDVTDTSLHNSCHRA
jgi:hypothetical protein